MNLTTSSSNMQLYFAYGSNLDRDQMRERCPGAIPAGRATLQGWRFQINDRGVATIVPDKTSVVHGGLWQVTEDHLATLDHFEGVHQDLYVRHQLTVMTANGPESAKIYIEPTNAIGVARPGYLLKVCRGARWFGLDESYCAFLAAGGAR